MHANACAESEHTGFRQPLPLDFGRYVVGRGRLVTVALQLGRYQWLAVTSACRGSNGRSKPLYVPLGLLNWRIEVTHHQLAISGDRNLAATLSQLLTDRYLHLARISNFSNF